MTYPKVETGRAQGAPAPGVPQSPRFPEVEERVGRYWDADGTFQASIDARPADTPDGRTGGNEFVFYDGPPFANGLPHYGHLLTGYVKDVIPRYQTMRGRRVERRFGWDCHGLPAEVEAEQQLGITHKSEIEAMGVGEFNAACKASVLRYTKDWEDYVHRQARWVDFEHDYKTLDLDYMESVMWAFKSLWDKGLIYEGFRVLAYCSRCETPLSNTETRMDDVYRERQDPASTVWFELENGDRALAWTTMPWTLVPNAALVVGPDIDYVVVESGGHRYVLAEARLAAYERDLPAARVVRTLKGSELVGLRYTPIFDFLTEQMAGTPAFTVLAGDFVSVDEGTGIVQVAPGHGEDDFAVCTAAGIPTLMTVDERARFTSVAPRFAGLHVFEANRPLLRELRERGVLVRTDTYEHPYPHCWRCDTPLVYKAVSSWFVRVSAFKDRMVELNQQITWVPEHIRDGSFGKWLANARDWSISRNRYWGSPIPVWASDDPSYPRVDVYGSLDELERDFGVRPTDLHRPFVDELTRPNPDDPTGRSRMRRVPEVLDCWFESGSMPFAQVHYPFENRDWFEHHYPGDFIVEYIGQTRGWFYTLHVLATALFDRPAFSTCLSHGILLGDDGRKMSKSLRNYPDTNEVFDRDGSDAMRWFLMSSPVLRGGNLVVTEQGIRDGVRQVLIPLWSVWSFFALYANAADGGSGHDARWRTDSTDVLDRYVLAKAHDLTLSLTGQLDAYDVAGACAGVREFVDVLTNWYVRRSRERFWAEDADAFDTLYTVLEVLCRLAAPLLPLVTEDIWRGLTAERSVHLTDWPDPALLPADDDLVAGMDQARAVASATLGLRKTNALRVRQPLRSLTVVTPDPDGLAAFTGVLADEVNVKEVRLIDAEKAEASEVGISRRLIVNARAAGPRLGSQVQAVIQASKAGDWQESPDGVVVCGGVPLLDGEYSVETVVADAEQSGLAAAVLPDGGFVVLDTALDDDLRAEGWARDLVRQIQDRRKAEGLHVSDRIRLRLQVPAEQLSWTRQHLDFVGRETLADDVQVEPAAELAVSLEQGHVTDGVPRAAQVYAEILARAPEHDLVPSLDRIAAVVGLLGDPQRSFQVVHVSGTNGKTSTTRLIERLLREYGLRTGRFTSPHLSDVRERISLDGVPLSPDAFVQVYEEVRPYLDLVDAKTAEHGGPRLTFFEVLVAMAYAAFADAPVDVAAVEVGMGGSWDATNVADGTVAVLTPIALDHERFLGRDLVSIATEKAGIIKPGSVAVLARQPAPAAEVLIRRVAEVDATVAREGVEFGVLHRELAIGGQMLALQGLAGVYEDVFLPLHGAHQAGNAVCALAAVEAFLGARAGAAGDGGLDADLVRVAFADVDSPGRLEVVRRDPTVLVDAAHNPAGAEALAEALTESFAFRHLVGVVGVMVDKDAEGILASLEPVLDEVVVTRSGSPRAMPVGQLAALAEEIFTADRVHQAPRTVDAVDLAIELAERGAAGGAPSGVGVVATGSIALAAEIRAVCGAVG